MENPAMKMHIYFLIVFLSLSFFLINCESGQTKEPSKQELVERGAYLVGIAGCNDCHTPKVFTPNGPMPDKALLLSGHPHDANLPPIGNAKIGPGEWVRMNDLLTAFVGPWGMSFAANLTPDDQTGIGLWTEENFINALRTGKHMGLGRPLLPPMPWYNLAHAKDEDLKAIFAYLRSIKPVKNLVPGAVPLADLQKKP